MAIPSALLKDLITATSVSLSPSVAWAAFAFNWKAKQAERREILRLRLFEVKEELDHIKYWAHAEYAETAHSDDWRNPSWAVKDFPSTKIHGFNYIVDSGGLGQTLSEALIKLEISITSFRSRLQEHREFVLKGGKALLGPEYGTDPAAEKVGFLVSPAWVEQLYLLNKKIHVEGIATSKNLDGLHSTWEHATVETENAMKGLRQESRPLFLTVGHILAVILGVIGVGFLVSFFIVLLRSEGWRS